MDLFQIIPENFFSLLASKNKQVYFDCLVEAFKAYEEGSILGIDKRIIQEVIIDCLDRNPSTIEESDYKPETNSTREKANYIIRRLEEHGWIDIDVTNDYQEIINFRDYAIYVIEALMNISPLDSDMESSEEGYKGYIYTIYALLLSERNMEYGIVVEQVYKNTKLFIRELRKLDGRLKEYLGEIMLTSEIKDLLDNLVSSKSDLIDRAYFRLKTSDNINKYRQEIIKRLEGFLNNDSTMEFIVASYMKRFTSEEAASKRAYRDLNEVIDTFNHLDEIINEIDIKNKTYVNSTIAKIQFLLNDDNDVPGKLATILKYIATEHKRGKIDQAINLTGKIFHIHSVKGLQQNSLYTPRGKYTRSEPNELDVEPIDFLQLRNTFLSEHSKVYSEPVILSFLEENLIDNACYASNIIKYDSPPSEILMLLHVLIYACENSKDSFTIKQLPNIVEHQRFRFTDFVIIKEDK